MKNNSIYNNISAKLVAISDCKIGSLDLENYSRLCDLY